MRLFKIILAAVILIVNTAHGTQVLEFYPSGSSENRSDGSTIDHGIYINSNGDYQAKLPFEAVVFFPDRHSAYCMAQKNSSTGTPYMQIVEENLRISPDGGMVEGEVLGTRVSLDALPPSLDKEGYSAAYKVKNKNAAGKDGGGDAPAGAPTGSPDGFASESGLMSIQTVSDVAKSAVTAGVFTGVVTAAYRGMLIDSGTAADWGDLGDIVHTAHLFAGCQCEPRADGVVHSPRDQSDVAAGRDSVSVQRPGAGDWRFAHHFGERPEYPL